MQNEKETVQPLFIRKTPCYFSWKNTMKSDDLWNGYFFVNVKFDHPLGRLEPSNTCRLKTTESIILQLGLHSLVLK